MQVIPKDKSLSTDKAPLSIEAKSKVAQEVIVTDLFKEYKGKSENTAEDPHILELKLYAREALSDPAIVIPLSAEREIWRKSIGLIEGLQNHDHLMHMVSLLKQNGLPLPQSIESQITQMTNPLEVADLLHAVSQYFDTIPDINNDHIVEKRNLVMVAGGKALRGYELLEKEQNVVNAVESRRGENAKDRWGDDFFRGFIAEVTDDKRLNFLLPVLVSNGVNRETGEYANDTEKNLQVVLLQEDAARLSIDVDLSTRKDDGDGGVAFNAEDFVPFTVQSEHPDPYYQALSRIKVDGDIVIPGPGATTGPNIGKFYDKIRNMGLKQAA